MKDAWEFCQGNQALLQVEKLRQYMPNAQRVGRFHSRVFAISDDFSFFRYSFVSSAGKFMTPEYFDEHSEIQSCLNSMSSTLGVQWSWLLCACARFERVKTGNQ